MEQLKKVVLKKNSFTVKDHFSSKELFEIKWNIKLHCYETFPRPNEDIIHKYYENENYISHQSNINSIKDLIYILVRKYMIKTKLKWIKKKNGSNVKLLDIGCGVGEFLTQASQSGLKAIGIEPNDKARAIAMNKSLEVYKSTKELSNKKFDVVTLWHVLEHLHQPEIFLQEINQLLKVDAMVLIAAPNYKSYDAEYYREFWAAYDVPRHLYHFSKDSIEKMAIANGYYLKEIHPLKFDSFYVAMLSEKYKHGKTGINWLMQGWKSNYKAKRSGEWSSLVYVLKKTK